MSKHSDFHLIFFQIEGAWQVFTVVTKLIKKFKSLCGFGGLFLKIRDVCMDFERRISRFITWSLFVLKTSYSVKWPISTWSFMWWCQFIDQLKFETRPSSLINFGTANLYLLCQRSLLICTCIISSLQYWLTNWTTCHTCPLWVTLTKQNFKNKMHHLIKIHCQMAYCLPTHKARTPSTILSFDKLNGRGKLPNQAEVDWGLFNCRPAGQRTRRRKISYSTRQIIVNPIRFVLSNQNGRNKCRT